MSKRRPEDILKDIEGSQAEDAVDRVLSMRPGERQKELEAAGFTATDLHAKADAWHERMQRAAVEAARAKLEGDARVKSLHAPPRDRGALLLVAALAVAGVVLGLLLIPRSTQREAPIAVPVATAPPSVTVGAPAATQSEPFPDAAVRGDGKARKK